MQDKFHLGAAERMEAHILSVTTENHESEFDRYEAEEALIKARRPRTPQRGWPYVKEDLIQAEVNSPSRPAFFRS